MATELSIEEANNIVNAYGAVLSRASESGAVVSDSALLSHPKETIKSALLIALRHSSDIREAKALTTGYLSLADFQPGIGAPIKSLVSGATPAINTDFERSMRLISDQALRWEKWTAIARKEMEILSQELRANGF